jgi:D-glycero-D-manno-heptose 1,7-bisphosphate phosphatase
VEEMKPRRAVFLDRDGTLNELMFAPDGTEESPFRCEDLILRPGAGEFTRKMREAGYLAVLITNQPGVAKGKVTIDGLEQIHACLMRSLAEEGGGLDAIYYCPHHPVGVPGHGSSSFIQSCDCRKPAGGLLLRAAKEMNIELSQSWMIGDKMTDVRAGQAAGCRSVLLGENPASGPVSSVYLHAADLRQAAELILSGSESRQVI